MGITLKDAIENLKKEHPNLLGVSENQLIKMTPNNLRPNKFDNRLRISFWSQQNPEDAYIGVCSREVFENYISNPYKLAYLLCEPSQYGLKMQEIVDIGLDQLRDILLMDNIDEETGKPNTGLIGHKLKIFQHLEARLMGSVSHNINIKSQNIPLSGSLSSSSSNLLTHSEEDLIKKLRDVTENE